MTKEELKLEIEKLIDKYNRLLDSGKIKTYNEARTRNEFIEPLFAALGWDMRNKETDNEVTTEETVSRGRVDLAFRINNIPVMFLEAKALKADLDRTEWAEQIINYSWNKGVTWAVLTDFESVKVFNAETPPKNITQNLFFEIKWNEYLEKFDQLWLLSKESFELKSLDKEADKWGKRPRRKRVGEKLFEDLNAWRELLSSEFKKRNSIKDDELDEGVQRILDRLIFIRTSEDRGIEPNVLASVVRDWENAGKKKALYPQLAKIFREFDDGYNSKLFTPHYCEDWIIYDKAFQIIIDGLYQTDDDYRYDFSAISGDVLGGIYEQYLVYILKKAKNKIAPSTKENKRKLQAIFYTRPYIVDFLVKETLGKVLAKTKVKNIDKIKVLDPACGSGSFLIAAYDEILETIHKENRQNNLTSKFDVLERNLYGVDIDPQAVEIAQLNLLLKALSQRARLPFLQNKIKTGNSLIEGDGENLSSYFGDKWNDKKPFNWRDEFRDVFAQDGFDVIIGNPPYVFARGGSFSDSEKAYYYKNYHLAEYQLNTYLMFIEKAYSLLKEGGYFGFIIPNNWLTIDAFYRMRKFLLERCGDLKIINIYDRMFQDADVDSCFLIFRKGEPDKVTLGEMRDGEIKIFGKFSPSIFKNMNGCIINISLAKNKNTKTIMENITGKSKPLSDFATVSTGLKAYQIGKGCPKQNEKIKNTREYHSNKKVDSTYKKYLDGKNVGRYQLTWSGEYLSYGEWLAEPRKSVPFNKPRILVRQIPSPPPYSINAVYTEKEYLNDINSMVVFDFILEPLYLLAVLNSRLMTFWFVNAYDKLQRKTFPQFKVNELAAFPIPKVTTEKQNKIASKATAILEINNQLLNTPQNTDKYAKLLSEQERAC